MSVGWELWGGGSLLLSLTDDASGDDFWFETLADGWDLGSPEAVKAVFASLAADGDDERIMRHGNRRVPFRVKVCGPDLAVVAAGERALRLALNRAPRLELRYTPPDGYGEVTVFDVVLGEMPSQPDDLALVQRQPWAEYAVTLTCRPFVRPVDPVTVSLSYSGTAPTTLKDGTSTVGVAGTNGPDPLALSAVTYLGETAVKGTPTIAREGGWSDPYDEYEFTAVTLTAALPFFAVDVALDSPLGFRLDQPSVVASASAPGMQSNPVGFNALANGYRRYYFMHTLAGSTVDVTIRVRMQQVYAGGTPASYIGGLYSAPTAPASGLLVGEVAGSERAPMSLRVSKSTSGTLGRTVVFSDPAMLQCGYNPGVALTWEAAPAGSYTVGGATGVAGDTYVLTINGQSSTTYCSTTGEELFFEFHLGSRRDGKLGTLTVSGTVNGSVWSPTGLKLYRNAPETALVSLPNVAARYLFIESPTLERPAIGIYAGSVADGSDATSIINTATSVDPLLVVPPLYAVWVDSLSTGLAVEADYYPLSHTFVSSRVGVS